MKKDEVMLTYAEINAQFQNASISFEEFLLQNKVTKGREFRKYLRSIRKACKETIDKSLVYEKDLRERKRGKNAGWQIHRASY